MSVVIFDRIGTETLVRTVDVRGNRSVEDTADEVKAREIGRLLCDWWCNGGEAWGVKFHLGVVGGPTHAIDLRRVLLRALTDGLRISVIPAYLIIDDAGASSMKPATLEQISAMGRDLLAWWAEPGGRHILRLEHGARKVRYDIRIGMNQSMRRFQVARERSANGSRR